MKRLIYSTILALCLVILIMTPIFAFSQQNNPDSPPTISHIWGARNLQTTGDMLIFFMYDKIPYASPPPNNVHDAFTFELWDSTDSIRVGFNSAFAWPDAGYNGGGVVSFYFTPATNPGWNVDYKIHIKGNAGYFASPPDYSFDMLADTDYSTFSNQASARAEVRAKIITITQLLEKAWSNIVIPPASSAAKVSLLDQSDVGDVFSLDGELYYREAIPMLQFICPNLFYFQLSDPNYGERSWTNNAQPAIEAQFAGTQVAVGVQAGGDLLGVSPMVTGAIVVMALCVILVYIHVRKAASINSGLMDIYPVILVSSLMSFFPFVIACFIDFLAWCYLGWMLFFRR